MEGIWRSKSGYHFKVLMVAQQAQDCSLQSVIYKSLQDTEDSSKDTVWVLDKNIFVKRMVKVK